MSMTFLCPHALYWQTRARKSNPGELQRTVYNDVSRSGNRKVSCYMTSSMTFYRSLSFWNR